MIRRITPCCLPADSGGPAPGKAPALEPGGGTETVLVVEDEEMVREAVVNQLEALGYTVHTANHGPGAVEVLDSDVKLDLILTDMVMPRGMTGRDVAEAARRRRPGLPVLFMSGYAEDMIDTPRGNVLLLQKPFRLTELARMVRVALGDPSQS